MCSSEALREFITNRLTAAAAEIFTVFQQTIDQYEEEIDRHRRLLQTHTHDNICQLETSFSLKEEEPEPLQEREILLLKQEPADDENLQPPPASKNSASAPTFSICYDVHRQLDQEWKPTIMLDLPQQHVSQDEEPAQVQKDQEEQEQLLLNQESDSVLVADTKSEADSEQIISKNYSLAEDIKQEQLSQEEMLCDQGEQEPDQIQVKQEHFSTFQEQEQLLPKHESNTVPLTVNEKQCEPCQSEGDSEPVLHNKDSPPEDHQQEDLESGSMNHTEQESNNRHNRDTEIKSFILKDFSVGQECNTPFSCDICGKHFNQSLSLKEHIKYHKRKKNHSCETCGKGFITKRELKEHMGTHTGEKPHSCEICGKCFIQKNNLKSHMKTHTGERPYSCEICGKGFIKNNNLKSHIKTHTGERPHSCETCGKTFIQRNNLLGHMRTHTGEKPHSCEICGKRFAIKQAQIRHMRTHTGEKPHSCEICGKSFSIKQSLNRHMRTHASQKP
ncbi:zinc finger protein 180-like [Gouania willdenowi]|uniref:Zinc finger protein 180-like n=1 Tax=Gouania willdenowi TaxID=441366 RepID=A0A8C5G217_GOUWI|nr:zinc finger protein 180-like [Gouania willdenowi]